MSVAVLARRDGRYCVHCGAVTGLSCQHRIRKGMGGSRYAERWSNGLILCLAYNVLIEQRADVWQEANEHGWALRTWESTTAVPFYDVVAGRWVTVDDEGGRVEHDTRPTV